MLLFHHKINIFFTLYICDKLKNCKKSTFFAVTLSCSLFFCFLCLLKMKRETPPIQWKHSVDFNTNLNYVGNKFIRTGNAHVRTSSRRMLVSSWNIRRVRSAAVGVPLPNNSAHYNVDLRFSEIPIQLTVFSGYHHILVTDILPSIRSLRTNIWFCLCPSAKIAQIL